MCLVFIDLLIRNGSRNILKQILWILKLTLGISFVYANSKKHTSYWDTIYTIHKYMVIIKSLKETSYNRLWRMLQTTMSMIFDRFRLTKGKSSTIFMTVHRKTSKFQSVLNYQLSYNCVKKKKIFKNKVPSVLFL